MIETEKNSVVMWLAFGVIVALLVMTHRPAFAFSDRYEPDDEMEQATMVLVGDKISEQHTLHSTEDQDWFKFYARAKEHIRYNIKVSPVGTDIRVKIELYDSQGELLKTVNDGYEGENESISQWRALSDGFYYLKISDSAEPLEHCRLNIQYQLQISAGIAPIPGAVKGIVRDAISANPLNAVIIYTNCHEYDTTISFEDGDYFLIHYCAAGLYQITAESIGYQTLSCHIPIPEIATQIRDIALLPNNTNPLALSPAQILFRNGDNLQPSKKLYHNGDSLKVKFQLMAIPSYICARYYVGIAYPDGRFFIVTKLNQFEPFDWQFLPLWKGTKNTVIDKPIDSCWPRGDYFLYLLRMPANIEEPMNHLDKGELNVTTFQVE
jgi:hypothetical protein